MPDQVIINWILRAALNWPSMVVTSTLVHSTALCECALLACRTFGRRHVECALPARVLAARGAPVALSYSVAAGGAGGEPRAPSRAAAAFRVRRQSAYALPLPRLIRTTVFMLAVHMSSSETRTKYPVPVPKSQLGSTTVLCCAQGGAGGRLVRAVHRLVLQRRHAPNAPRAPRRVRRAEPAARRAAPVRVLHRPAQRATRRLPCAPQCVQCSVLQYYMYVVH